MKLGVAYIVFDGIELLEYSIKPIRQHVDFITVIYQNVSWFGSPMTSSDLVELTRLKKEGIIDELINFTDFNILSDKKALTINKSKVFETRKRQFGLARCLQKQCTHYLCMDVDEFYESAQFFNAKTEIIKNGYSSTAAPFINYVNTPTVHRGYSGSRVPFICKVDSATKLGPAFFVKCDPSRGISNSAKNTHDFPANSLTMHHMETVRKNLLLKYESTTRGLFDRSKTAELIASIKSVDEKSETFDFKKIIFPKSGFGKLTHCQNSFGIPYETWKK